MIEPGYLTATRTAYDRVAADYTAQLRDELAAKPLDRALLAAFAELVAGAGPVADVGCGPGRITGHLHSLGVPAFGVDLSPEMVATARRAYPHLSFSEGHLAGLDLADGGLGGIVAWYSIIHTPPDLLLPVFVDFHRVLRPGGHLLTAFQAGDDQPVHLTHGYGHEISLDAYRLAPEHVAGRLRAAGFTVDAWTLREPGPREKTQQAYLMAHKN